MEKTPGWIRFTIALSVISAVSVFVGTFLIFSYYVSRRDANEHAARETLFDAVKKERALLANNASGETKTVFEDSGYRFVTTRDFTTKMFEIKAEPTDKTQMPGSGSWSFLITEEGFLMDKRGVIAPTRGDPEARVGRIRH